MILDILGRIEEVGFLAQALVGSLERVADLCMPTIVGTTLRGNEDNTITSLGAIDSSGSGIFQDLHRLDERGIEVLNVVDLQTVNDQQWGVVTIGTITTHTDFCTSTRRTTVDDLHTCNLTLQCSTGIRGSEILNVVTVDRSNSTGQVALLLNAITDDYHIVEHAVVFF